MRTRAILGVLALGVALLAVPAGAVARTPPLELRGSVSTSTFVRGSHGYIVFISVSGGQALLLAQRSSPDGGDSVVSYSRRVPRGTGGRLHFGLGRAGEVDLRLAVEKVEERKPSHGCTGGPAIEESGRFSGTVSFHPPGGFTDLTVHRTPGAVDRQPPLVCHGRWARRVAARFAKQKEEDRRLIAGDPDGRRRFEVTTAPRFSPQEPVIPSVEASVTHWDGPVTIDDLASAASSTQSAPFLGVPDLEHLPAIVTVEPPAPFSGAATFELPSPRTAQVTGDLTVRLPEVGDVQLTGPRIDSGVCHGRICTKSLPKALRPSPSRGVIVGTFTVSPPEEVPTK